jgi:hypothetical protein
MGQTLSEPVIDKVRMLLLLARWSDVLQMAENEQAQDRAWRARAWSQEMEDDKGKAWVEADELRRERGGQPRHLQLRRTVESKGWIAARCRAHAQSFGTELAGMRTPQGASGPASGCTLSPRQVKCSGAQVVSVAHTVTPRAHDVAREECARGGWDGPRCHQQSARTGRLYADLCSTLQHTSAGEDDTLVYGVSEMQGWRISTSSAVPHR